MIINGRQLNRARIRTHAKSLGQLDVTKLSAEQTTQSFWRDFDNLEQLFNVIATDTGKNRVAMSYAGQRLLPIPEVYPDFVVSNTVFKENPVEAVQRIIWFKQLLSTIDAQVTPQIKKAISQANTALSQLDEAYHKIPAWGRQFIPR